MDAPDIGSIVSMIMSNPGLVEQIAGMVKGGSTNEPEPKVEANADIEPAVEREALPPIQSDKRVHRAMLANAMKPYLSENRQRAIDAMLSIADIIDITREKN